ncbi:transcriptional regulator with GAF, ATPase, and Fis domain [Amycolatopsis lexingtonensis]|uniref:Transcriptional regulator with GAF, ATPase, and Fis domain n=1 Tax=Amycolatopsis lexingtonensis TaxID=218822 RepID=A0ABR9HWM5_9PSEU|nr:sigma 54-interacting transcriptional regulator [Amycolatopsis lexingtonensis]MBE1495334.1 transcriptional regulator with GAF, ATPase, and Fis domain [Amycolatopsis lexingtonensis]
MTTAAGPAATVDAWLEVAGTPGGVLESFVRALGELDVALRPGDDGPRNGVLAFDTPTPAVADRLRAVSRERPGRVLAVSTSGRALGADSWALLRAGASDACTWRDGDATAARHVAERLRRWQAIDELLACRHVQDFLVGDSPVWQATLRDAVEVARFTGASVLITGESGTGKERVAQLIHELDPRRGKKKLVVLDCSTVVPSLSGSEFFGHEKGAFTGAAAPRAGAFELADGGTLFLDEVGELPAPLQAELLRVIQEGTFKRVGSNLWRKSSFRLVCATNRDLTAARAEGAFRDDFYYRIAECTLRLPSLRERTGDIIPLFRHFFRQARPDAGPPELEDAVRELLVGRSYPGNVRDLRSLVLRIVHRHLGNGVVTVGDVPDHEWPDPDPAPPAGCTSCGAPRG